MLPVSVRYELNNNNKNNKSFQKSSQLSIESRSIFDRFYMAEEPEKCNLATILDEFLSVVVYFCNYFEAALFVYHNADAPIEFTDTLITW